MLPSSKNAPIGAEGGIRAFHDRLTHMPVTHHNSVHLLKRLLHERRQQGGEPQSHGGYVATRGTMT
jgi:hypothetical protein